MKRICKRLTVLLLALCLLAGCAASGSGAQTADSTRYKVALVAKSTQTDFWKAVFVGAEAAATEYNMDLTIDGPDTEEDYETQNQMIADAVANGAQALVFSAIDYDANAPAIEAAKQFIVTNMPEGHRLAKEIKNLAAANKISDGSLQRAREELGIITKKTKEFPPRSIWILPGHEEDQPEEPKPVQEELPIDKLLNSVSTEESQ